MSGAVLNIVVGATGHTAVVVNKNLDGSDAVGVAVTFSTSDPSICDISGGGDLVPLAIGTVTITEVSTRGTFTHSDSGTVNVTSATSGDDFTSELTFT